MSTFVLECPKCPLKNLKQLTEYNKICNYCQKEFIAKTRVTQFCGDHCAKRGYKLKKKLEADNYFNDQEATKKLLLKIHITLELIEEALGKMPQQIIKDIKRDYMTAYEFCEVLKIHPRTLRRWMQTNMIEYSKQGKTIVIKTSEIEKCKHIAQHGDLRAYTRGDIL